MSALRSIVYVSTAVREMSEFELEALLRESRALNTVSNVTGMLLYSGGGFMQCIEGTEDAIRKTYERIRRSRKHHGLIELADESVAHRSFPDFQMGFLHATRAEALRQSTAIWQRRVDARSGLAASAGIASLEMFWNQTMQRA